jgi:imidazolonepropionase-like amidohydrolase
MGALAILRSKLDDVRRKIARRKRAKGRKKAEIELSAEEEVLRSLLERKAVYRVHVHKADDVAALLRVADEFKLRITCEHTCDVHDIEVFRQLAKRRVPVVYGPLDSFAYKVELKHESWRNVKLLVDSGVEFGLMTDHPIILQRTLLLTLRWFLRAGLSKAECVGIVTKQNARILGIDRMLGTLARGKWASFVCWNGDPFGLESWPVRVFGEGRDLYA